MSIRRSYMTVWLCVAVTMFCSVSLIRSEINLSPSISIVGPKTQTAARGGSVDVGCARISPDGSKVAYVVYEKQRFSLCVASFVDNGTKREITTSSSFLGYPRWSVDGGSISFATEGGVDGLAQVAVLDLGTSQISVIVSYANAAVYGACLATSSTFAYEMASPITQIWIDQGFLKFGHTLRSDNVHYPAKVPTISRRAWIDRFSADGELFWWGSEKNGVGGLSFVGSAYNAIKGSSRLLIRIPDDRVVGPVCFDRVGKYVYLTNGVSLFKKSTPASFEISRLSIAENVTERVLGAAGLIVSDIDVVDDKLSVTVCGSQRDANDGRGVHRVYSLSSQLIVWQAASRKE